LGVWSLVVLAAGVLVARPGGVPVASANTPLSISASPVLTPAFNPSVSDYTARCGTSLSVATNLAVTVSAPSGTNVSVAGTAPRSGAFVVNVRRAWDESFVFSVAKGSAAPVSYTVRCLPTDVPGITAVRSGTPQAAYYLLSAIGSTSGGSTGGFSTHYLEVVDTNGVPIWWYDTGYNVGDTKVLANGNIAWLPAYGPLGLTQVPFTGSPVTTVQVPDGVADFHDFEPLPNGDWLMESYPITSGVDLSSIGGLSNTCIVDAEVEEVTPTGSQVWSWFASQHLSPTEINADLQSAARASTCAAPVDVWHLNSLQSLGSDFLVSLRFTNAAFRVNIASGNVVWKLGGTPTPQSLTISGDPLNGFVGQHDARLLPDGSVTVFDNGNDSVTAVPRPARMPRYQIDATAGTATMVQQIQDPNIVDASFCCGDARPLPGGDWVIGYGLQGVNTEVTSSGSRVLSLNFDDPSSDPAHPAPGLFSYRMTPVLPGTLTRAELRAGMDTMHPTTAGAPRHAAAVPYGSGRAKVVWDAPVTHGGAAITGYVITPYLGTVAQPAHTFSSTATSAVVAGLRNGKKYQFVVAARNAFGSGGASPKSAAVVVGAPGRPGLPIAKKTASRSLRISFAAPANNGARITRYTVACASSNGGAAKTASGATTHVTVTGLTARKVYTCTVTATNARGTGTRSMPSAAVTV
jgi:hypothetical protein